MKYRLFPRDFSSCWPCLLLGLLAEDSPIALYHFDEMQGDVVHDSSGLRLQSISRFPIRDECAGIEMVWRFTRALLSRISIDRAVEKSLRESQQLTVRFG